MHRPLARRAIRLAAWALLAPFCSLAAADEHPCWPGYRGFEGRGSAERGLPPGEGPLGLELRWKKDLGSGYSGIAVAEGALVTALSAGERDVVAALDPVTGDERWRQDLGPTYVGHDGSHDGPIATPCIAGGRVFALGPFGHLAAFDLQNGEPLWRVHLVADLGSTKPMYGFGSSPVVVGDTVVLQVGGPGGSVAGLDVATGEVRWRSVDDSIFAQSPIAAEIAGRHQVLVIGERLVAGIDPRDGEVLWRHVHRGGGGAMGALTSSPLPLDARRLFLKHDNNRTLVLGLEGEETEDFGPSITVTVLHDDRDLSKSYSPPALWDGRLYGYTSRFLSAMDPETGELLWKSRDPGDGFVVAVGGQLAVLTKKGSLHLGAASPEGWTESARLDLFEDVAWTPPSFADGALYVRSLGEIARVDLVRAERALTQGGKPPLPRALVALAAQIDSAVDPAAAIDRFLEGRELPLVDGKTVVFLWRGPARDVAIAGDMIGMRREEPMHRLEGTDLWWWATELDPRARVSYLFFADYDPQTDPAHDRTHVSTVLGPDMNWRRGPTIEMSWLAMPDWPGKDAAPRGAAGDERPGRLEKVTLSIPPASGSSSAPSEAPVHVWLPPGYDEGDDRYPVLFVHDPFAREVGGWPQALDRVVGRTVAPLIVVFVEARLRGYEDVFARGIAPAVDERFRTRRDRRSRGNIGMGWQAHVAAAITFAHRESFGALGMQSFYALRQQMSRVESAMAGADPSSAPIEVYLEWGLHDLRSPHEAMDMRTSSREAFDLLAGRGYEPMGGEVFDSTDWGSWRNRTAVLLESLFPLEGEGPSPALARWRTGRP